MIDEMLEKNFQVPSESPFSEIYDAMRYTLFPGGKRIRSILTLATADALGKDNNIVLPIACALEAIHTYSLIHDDLPALDNDETRRGMPANHVKFGEDIAILAGDGLLTLAFEFLSNVETKNGNAAILLEAVYELARAAGPRGMVGGQACEVKKRKEKECELPILQFLCIHKTGMLIRAALTIPAKLLKASNKEYEALKTYGENLGLAFQIVDDIQDAHKGKKENFSFPSVMSLDECKARAGELKDKAISQLSLFGKKADPLRHIATFVVERMHAKNQN